MAILQSVRLNSLGLGLFAVLTAAVIAITQQATAERIGENERQAKARALYEIVPPEQFDNALLDDQVLIRDPELVADAGPLPAYIARRAGQAHTVLLPTVAPDGYTGNIALVIGVRRDGSVAGVRILSHKETPGLGDKIELKKSPWVLDFNDQRLGGADDPRWAVRKDGGQFDQFTGATITPRAVVAATKRALLYFRANRERLLAPHSDTPEEAPRG